MLKSGGQLVISHFILLAEINDVNPKAGNVVADDLRPPADTMHRWFGEYRLAIEQWQDNEDGYLVSGKLR